mgnify:CR=1 FL=1
MKKVIIRVISLICLICYTMRSFAQESKEIIIKDAQIKAEILLTCVIKSMVHNTSFAKIEPYCNIIYNKYLLDLKLLNDNQDFAINLRDVYIFSKYSPCKYLLAVLILSDMNICIY